MKRINAKDNIQLYALIILIGYIMLFFLAMIIVMCVTTPEANIQVKISIVITAIATSWLLYFLLTQKQIVIKYKIQSLVVFFVYCTINFVVNLYIPILIYYIGKLYCKNNDCSIWTWPIITLSCIALPYIVMAILLYNKYDKQFIRGTFMISLCTARKIAASKKRPGELMLDWGGVQLPESLSIGHFLLVGSPGSGKTVSLRLLMQSILPQICSGSDMRALIYDAKQDIYQILKGQNITCPIITLNPLDKNGAAWDIAKDITCQATALQVAQNFIPDESHSENAFFIKAARDLLAAVIIALHLSKPMSWSLAEVFTTLSDSNKTKELLESISETKYISNDYFSRDPKTLSNIQQTITAHLAMLRPVAGAWEHADQRISLTEWVNQESILILANDEALRGPLDALNAVIVQRLTQLVLAQSETKHRRTWFFLDELKEAGKLNCLASLMTKGRSKGARCLIAFQTIEGLRSVYGNDVTLEIANLCSNKAFLRTDSAETAKWAVDSLGQAEWTEWNRADQYNLNGNSHSYSEQIAKRETVLASELLNIPLATSQRFIGYFITSGIGVYKGNVVFSNRLMKVDDSYEMIKRSPEEQYIYDKKSNSHTNTKKSNPSSGIPLKDIPSPWDNLDH